MDKESALIGWHEIEILIHANHRDMVKYSSKEDENYKRVRGAIQEIVRDRIEANMSGTQGNLVLPRMKEDMLINVSKPLVL